MDNTSSSASSNEMTPVAFTLATSSPSLPPHPLRSARTASGRLVRFNFDAADRQQVSMTQRNGKNAPIQGTSADILKRALRLLNDELRDTSAKIVNIIHDEIVVEVDEAESQDIAAKVERTMCAAGEEYLHTVPVKVEHQIACEWAK